jgi:hypothetical protein
MNDQLETLFGSPRGHTLCCSHASVTVLCHFVPCSLAQVTSCFDFDLVEHPILRLPDLSKPEPGRQTMRRWGWTCGTDPKSHCPNTCGLLLRVLVAQATIIHSAVRSAAVRSASPVPDSEPARSEIVSCTTRNSRYEAPCMVIAALLRCLAASCYTVLHLPALSCVLGIFDASWQ